MFSSAVASAHDVVRAFAHPRNPEGQRPASLASKSVWVLLAWLLSALGATVATPAAALAAPPAITSISPSNGSQAGGTQVHVFGSNLDTVDTAIFGADTLAAISHVSSGELIVTTPSTTTLGAVNLQLFRSSVGSNVVQFTYTAGPPSISSVDNPTGPLGGGTTITIHGAFLANPTAVMFGANAGTIVSSNYYEVVATSPAGAAPGYVGLTVVTAGGTSNAGSFNYQTPGAPLDVAGYIDAQIVGEPTTGQIYFTGDAGVGPYSYAVTSGTLLPGLVLHPDGTISGTPTQMGPFNFTITVTDSTPGAPRSGSATLSGNIGRGEFGEANYLPSWEARAGQSVSRTYTIGILHTDPVTWSLSGNVPVGIIVDSNTGTVHGAATQEGQFNFTLTATDSTTGTGPIVRNYNIQFTATASLVTPVVSSVSPTIGSANGGTSVTITGSDFTGVTAVGFGGANGSFTVDSDTQITATTPAHTAGLVDVVVANADHASSINANAKFTYIALPAVTGVSPAKVALAGGGTITVTGTTFTGATGVTVGGASVAFTQISDSQVSFTAPAHAAGIADIVVTTVYGSSANSAADDLTYVAAPSVTGVAVPLGPLAGGNSVVIAGADFTSATQVFFGTDAATSFVVNSSTQITAVAPAHAAGGPAAIKVVTPFGEGTGAGYSWVAGPTVTAVSPATGSLSGNQTITLTGTGFTGATAVLFGGTFASAVTVLNDTTLTVSSPPSGAPGPFNVTVTAPGGTSATSAGAIFTYVSGPIITGISPTSGSTAGGTTVVITGTGFTGATAVSVGAAVAPGNITVNSDTQITIITPARSPSTTDIRVTTPGGVSPTTSADRFTFTTPPGVPVLNAPAPNAISATATPTFSGTKAANEFATIYVDGAAIGVTPVNGTTIWSFTPTTSLTNGAHTWTARRTNSSGIQGNAATARNITVAVSPTVTGISPTVGDFSTLVTITGKNFTGATAVNFGSTPAIGLSVDSDTQISAQAPAQAAGPVDVRVTTPGGTSPISAGDVFQYTGPVDVTGISPTSGPETGGTVVTITGTGFLAVTEVAFAGLQPFTGAPAASFEIVSNTEIRAVSPAYTGETTLFVYSDTTDSSDSSDTHFQFVPVVPPVEITTNSLPDAQIAAAYEQTLTATGGSGSFTYAVTAGELPAGLTLDADKITGTPTAGGPFTFTITATDTSATPKTDAQAFTLTVLPPEFSPSAGPDAATGVVGEPLEYGFTYMGGTGPLTFSYTGELPEGVTFADGVISGTPTQAGEFVFTVVGTDASTGAGPYSRSQTVTLTVSSATPTVTGVSPAAGLTGASVTITGTNFTGATAVSFGATAAKGFTVDSATSITATAPGGTGTVDIRVTTPGGTSATSAADQFTYIAPPSVTSLSPTAGPTSGGTSVTITGTNFIGVTAVSFGATAATGFTFNSATSITATAPAKTGTVDVRVTTPGGTSATSAADQFTYVSTPTVTSITPTAGPTSGGTTVVITGTILSGATSVTFGATAATGFTVNSATQITATAPAGTGTVDVRISTVGGTSATSAADQFTYVSTPTVTSITPTAGPTSGGTTVVITGTNLSGATAVTFGVTAATGFTVNSATQITATAPAGTGTVDVRITTIGGTSATSAADQYTYVGAPTVSSVSPTAGPSTGGTSVTITGANFSGATAVTFGATAATGFTVNSATQITATAPAGTGTVDVRVTTTGGTSATSAADQFTYVARPAVGSISPTAGPTGGGTSVTITGTSFTGVTAVTFGATAATGFTFNSATQITATAPAGTGTVDIRVTTPGGTSATSAADQFTYVPAPSAPTAVTPANGARTNDSTPDYAGAGPFGATVTVYVDGSAIGTTTVSGGTWILTQPTPLADGSHSVKATATTAGGVSAESNTNSFTVDTQGPAAPVVTAPVNGASTSDNTPTVTGTAEANATVRVYIDGEFSGLASLTGTTWTYTPGALADGTHALWATATDIAGNLGPQSATLSFSIDTGAPAAPVITAPANGSSSVDDTVTVTGTSEESATVTVYIDGASVGTTMADASGNWSLTTGTLAIGPHTAKATAIDASGNASAASTTNTFTVLSPVTLPTDDLSAATVGVAYSTSFDASGGSGTYSYAVAGGALPAGLTLDGATGELAGTPTAGGAFNFQIKATDSANAAATVTQAYTLTVNAPTIVVAPATLSAGDIGAAYSQTIKALGGTPSYAYAVTAGALPGGLSLDETSGLLSGTPTTVGTFNFTITATDSSTGTGPYTGMRAYAVTINQVLPVPGAVTVSTAYNTAVGIDVAEANSGQGIPTGASVSGAPSHGTTSVSGTVITYTPSTGYNGPDSFTYATSNSAGTSATTATVSITIGAPTLTVSLSPSAFQVGAAYSGSVSTSGGQSPYSYEITAGALPAGLTFNATGQITGTPSAAGAYAFTVTATDSSTGAVATASQSFSGTVGAASIILTPSNLSSATVAQPFTASFGAAGGTAPYSYALTAGALPAGLALAGDGTLSGTPTAGGVFNFTITATDSSTGAGAPFSGSQSYQLTVGGAAIVIAPTTLPAGQASFAYAQSLSATGGIAPYSYAVTAGALPAGLTLSPGGALSGTPTTAGTFDFTVTATDSSTGDGPYEGAVAYSLSIGQPPAPTVAPVTATVAYNSTGEAIALAPSGDYVSVSATQPAHGSVTFTGTTATYVPATGYFGADSFTYTATGPGGTSASATVSITVGTPAAPTVAPVSANVDFNSSGQAVTLAPSGVYTSLDATQPAHGTVTVSGSTATYTPATGYYGTDSFTYTAAGPGGVSGPATVSLTIAQPEAPTPAPEQPAATAVTDGSVTVNLADYADGEITGFRVTDAADHGQFTIGNPGARTTASTAAAQQFTATYTPAANFMGVDSVTVVAFGPGGDSAPITISFNVAGQAPDLSASVLSNGSVDVHPTAALVGGPFQGLRITTAPAYGAASVNGLDVRFTPGGPNATPATIGYVVVLPFGESQPGTITIVVAPVPTAQDITATTPAGRPVTVSLTAAAQGGPFTGATITGISPSSAGTATITEAGPAGAHTYSLTFTPADAFTGVADIGFTLSNASGASSPAKVTVTVVARPDPSLDPDVRGLVSAQAGATARFADGQMDNFNRRLEQIRDGSNESSFGLNLSTGGDEIDPQDQRRQRLGIEAAPHDRDWMMAAPEPFILPSLRAAPQGPPPSKLDERPSVFGAWTAGNIDFGRRDVQTGQRDNRFTTSALSGGVDMRVSDSLVIGGGIGYGEDVTKVGDNGTRSEARTVVGAVYAGYHPNETVFLDGVLGYGDLSFDTRRYDQTAGAFTFGSRNGDMVFGSVTAGLEQETGDLRWSPYGRVDMLSATLSAFTESGAGIYDLAYQAMDVSSQSGTLGVRAWWATDLGGLRLQPRTRVEWVYEFQGDATQVLRYADWLGSPHYSFDPEVRSRSTVQVELGFGMDMGDGFQMEFDYRGAFGENGDITNGLRFGLKGSF